MDFMQHIPSEVLQVFLKDDLTSPHKDIVRMHLSFCPICQEQKDGLLLDELTPQEEAVLECPAGPNDEHIEERVLKDFWRGEIKETDQMERISDHCVACRICRGKRHDLWLSTKKELAQATVNETVKLGFLLSLVARARRIRSRGRRRHNRRARIYLLVGLPLAGVVITALSTYLLRRNDSLIPVIDRGQINIAHSIGPQNSRPGNVSKDTPPPPTPLSNDSISRVEHKTVSLPHRNTSKRSDTQPERDEKVAKSWEYLAQVQTLKLEGSTDDLNVRGANENEVTINPLPIFRSRTYATQLRIELPENSRKGQYVVSIQDPAHLDSPIDTSDGESADGKQISVLLNLQSVPANVYQLSITRKDEESDEEEFLGYFPVRVIDLNNGENRPTK